MTGLVVSGCISEDRAMTAEELESGIWTDFSMAK
jgi:hypothetical protein